MIIAWKRWNGLWDAMMYVRVIYIPFWVSDWNVNSAGLWGQWDCLCLWLCGILGMSHTLSNNVHHGSSQERSTQTGMSDRGVEPDAPNVDLMMGALWIERESEGWWGKEKNKRGTDFSFFFKWGHCGCNSLFYPSFFVVWAFILYYLPLGTLTDETLIVPFTCPLASW